MTAFAEANEGAWSKAEQLTRRVFLIATMPLRSENHPTWDPVWRAASEKAFLAVGSGDEQRMDMRW